MPVLLGTGDLPAGVSVPDLTRRAAEHGAAAGVLFRPARATSASFYGEVVGAAGSMPVLAYHWPRRRLPASAEDLKAPKVAGQGFDRRHRTDARGAGVLQAAVLRRQLTDRGLRGHARVHRRILAAANLEPERCIDVFAATCPPRRHLLSAPIALSATYGVKGIKEELARRHGTSTVCR